MRITEVRVENFKALTEVRLQALDRMVVIAGPNGCGKSCLFDAIRLLKSAYGGYQPNEWQNWFGEFQINVNQTGDQWMGLLQRKDAPMRISASFELAVDEVTYLKENADSILLDQIWREEVPELAGWRSITSLPLATHIRTHEPRVLGRLKNEKTSFIEDLKRSAQVGSLTVQRGKTIVVSPSRVLEILFTRYEPERLGIIDYHGANRNYAREQVAGINLNIDSGTERLRQHALYNSSNKYQNLKTEMASVYVRQILAKDAGAEVKGSDLIETLKELFGTFFPGKEFLGPRPTPEGAMTFPVRTASGETHDIDDLSSGEKEVLYGYLRLRNAAPKNSVLLIDEPELHLNPRLVRGLASFYHRHIGTALNNQLWLVTHSDSLIREAVGQVGFSVYHLQAPGGEFPPGKQATRMEVRQDLDRAIFEIAGDLAAYRPGAKVVIFEGDTDDGFDVRMTGLLFPRFQESVNMLSVGSKRRVVQLQELLREAQEKGVISNRFFAITDRDSDQDTADQLSRNVFSWDTYHIENYLLEPEFILTVLGDLNRLSAGLGTVQEIEAALIRCASETVGNLVSHKVRAYANEKIVSSLDLGFDPKRTDVGAAVSQAVFRSVSRMSEEAATTLNKAELTAIQETAATEALSALNSSGWRTVFRGRDVLRRFAGKYGGGVDYQTFRDLIIARMRDAGFHPIGMAAVLNKIIAA